MNFILADSAVFWIITSIIFAIIELFIFSKVGSIYVSISSVVTAFLIYAEFISAEALISQFGIVVTMSLSLMIISNLIIKKVISKSDTTDNVSNIIGKQAIIINDGINKGTFGCIRFAGQVMTAKLAKDVQDSYVPEGTFVEILAVNGTIVTIRPNIEVVNNIMQENNIEKEEVNSVKNEDIDDVAVEKKTKNKELDLV